MEISIYQINMKRDINRLAFCGLEDMENLGHGEPRTWQNRQQYLR